MGFLNKKPIIKSEGFHPIELNEDNVQAIFNRCIAKEGTPEDRCFNSILFSRTLGYRPSDELLIRFDMEKMRMNKKSIEYLHGQLRCAHQKLDELNLEEAYWNYQGNVWTNNKEHLLEFLHLGCTDGNEMNFISPFLLKVIRQISMSLPPPSPRKTPTFQRGGRPTRASGRTDGIVRVCTIELGGLP